MNKAIICIDRDGTLIHDSREHLFLGSDNNWPEKVKILPNAIEGVRRLNTIAGAGIYMITNQPGVAISDFALLTEGRAREVCRFVVEMFKDSGARLDGYFLCPHATPKYVSRKPGTNFHPHLVHDCHCLKPGLGMVFNALKAEGITPENADIYVIGDRASDIRTALKIDGTGILIPFVNEPGELAKIKLLGKQGQIYVAETMFTAAEYIVSQVGKKSASHV
ncbi:MAG: hypothetical protein P1P89_20365 [Desulfobacterales bacterium]|nr:hypothetical protein [Desulfobacterales bacterium]